MSSGAADLGAMAAKAGSSAAVPGESVEELAQTLMRECRAMLYHALEHGQAVPPDLATQAADAVALGPSPSTAELSNLVVTHSRLSQLIAPATGRTIVLFAEERAKHPYFHMLGPVRIVRQMMLIGIVALIMTTGISTLPTVNVENVASGWFELDGAQAWGVIGFLLAVAGLGAAFANLASLNAYIDNANYDPLYEGTYWARLILGLISGVVLGEILFDLIATTKLAPAGDPHNLVMASERVVLAFLGGYAIAPVQKVLANLSDAVGTMLTGRNAPPPAPSGPPAVS